ncbi:PilZ domain-containing protein [Bowmanella sp. Y26]|uniref:PilZ domain-containing protein n=1 Tax=Bowmanella yangjiangensis TaxID=2811230 RepID=A0ABS3CYA3_9ALTE|nr:PilZ domain-containing protein [Bowmanella yangjiangensis]MBN7822109.1 PilZ domain-containing protein [Bowmanella yangjiangensis]MBT1065163.1 PilZ domain-containing protein [Bowmanella yangjiangensis]
MLGYDDKRDFFRMMVNTACELRITDDESSRTLSAICKDLSATGMSFEVEESIEAGTVVQAVLESSNSQIPSLNAKAKVVRCTAGSDNSYMVGVEIIEMS